MPTDISGEIEGIRANKDNPLSVSQQFSRHTSFGELLMAFRTSKFNFKPTWGTSRIRDTITETGTGASVSETNGEFKLSTGTATSNVAMVRTKERGQYQAGTEGETGLGVRIPANPTGTQRALWGYFDDNNGFGWGIDATGLFIFRRNGGTETKTYQPSFNEDTIDGSKGDKAPSNTDNPSGFDIEVAKGNIFQVNFVWYGYGSIRFYVNLKDPDNGDKRILAHTIQIEDQVSIIDPNQPLTVCVENGDTSDTNFDMYVGGRQFSIVDGLSQPNTRNTSIELPAYTASTTSYVAVAAIRKKTLFNGRENSVNCFINDIQVQSNNPAYVMIDFGGSVTDGSWGSPSDVDSGETAMEVNTTLTDANTTPFTAVDKLIVSGSASQSRTVERRERIAFGQDDVAIIYIKRPSTNATLRIIIDIEEEW